MAGLEISLASTKLAVTLAIVVVVGVFSMAGATIYLATQGNSCVCECKAGPVVIADR